MEQETLISIAIIRFRFFDDGRQRERMLEEKRGHSWSFNRKLGEHTASTTTSSEGLVWVFEIIISGIKTELTFLITLYSRRHFQRSAGDGLGSTILAPLWLVLCYVIMSMMCTLVLAET